MAILKQGDKETRRQGDGFLLVSPSPLLLVSLIIAAYLAIGFQYALLTPAWQVPDEPAHYNYVRTIAEHGALPVLNVGDYDQTYLSQLTSQGFPPELSVDSVDYESWQPPLYYLLASPIFLLFDGALLPLRVFSLLLGAGVIVFAFLAVREAVGVTVGATHESPLPLLAAGFIAFIPQHVAMMAGVNNDSLSELLIAIGLWLILRINRQIWDLGFGILGFVIGLAFITKSQAYVLAPVAGLMLLLAWRRNLQLPITNNQLRSLSTRLVVVFIPALLIGSLMWWRNITVYGWPDFMAASRHNLVVADQPRTSQWVAEFGSTEVMRRFFQTTFQSFWGQFGWMGVVMDGRVYTVLLVYTLLLIGGLVIGYWRNRGLENSPREASNSLISNYYLLITSGLLTLGLYLYYNLSYVQHQGRYLFPALIPLGLAAAVGLSGWGGILSRLTRRDMSWVVGAVALIAMAALDVFALYRFIVPALR
ncbi:MAG: glycosyltransferase family 39 protein [Chloroflexi bacterium]|nr:glycosyltransferase family 39 protein [Chloroflexota bacterium]